MFIGAITSLVSLKYLFVLAALIVCIAVLRANFVSDLRLPFRVVGNLMLCAAVGASFLLIWKYIPKPAVPPTLDQEADALADKIVHKFPLAISQSKTAFAISEGTAWVAPEFSDALYWVSFNGTKRITPIHVLAFYTITNLKSVPIMISRLSLEMLGPHNAWWTLNRLPTSQPIWAADRGKTPRVVHLVTLPDGFLINKAANAELASGHSVQGSILYQLPTDYPRLRDAGSIKLRLRVGDTAGDEEVQPPEAPSTNDNILYTMMRVDPLPNVDLSTYEVISYGEP